jgi:hypothetical protein
MPSGTESPHTHIRDFSPHFSVIILSVYIIPTVFYLNFESFYISDRRDSGHQRRMKALTAVSDDTDNGKEIRGFYVPSNSPTLQIV